MLGVVWVYIYYIHTEQKISRRQDDVPNLGQLLPPDSGQLCPDFERFGYCIE